LSTMRERDRQTDRQTDGERNRQTRNGSIILSAMLPKK